MKAIHEKNNINNQKNIVNVWFLLAIVLLTTAFIFLRQLTNNSLGYPDADRILMDGVFIHDFLLDFPITRIYDYTINYYAQYPALSIGYRPPFFPFIEGIFHLIFGVNMWSSRLAILFMAIIGFSSWFFLIRKIFDDYTAFFSLLLLITMPFVAKWSWYTMAEIPLISMMMLTAYLFFRYVEENSLKFLLLTAMSFTATVWTKQTAFYLAFWFVLYLTYEGSIIERFKEKKTWFAIIFVLIFLVPLMIITLWLGKQNLAQSIGDAAVNGESIWAIRLNKLPLLFKHLVNYQMIFPMLVLSVSGIVSALLLKERKTVFFALLIITTFLFFFYVVEKSERYTIFWLPAFAVFAALPLYQLKNYYKKRIFFTVLLLSVILYQIHLIYSKEQNYATGYDAAATYVLNNSRSPTVFVDAYNNGYFTYFMRSLDPKKTMYVLRADKLLSSSSITSNNHLTVHANGKDDIKKIFDKFAIDLIVVESHDISGINIHKELRKFLENGSFELVKSITVQSTRPPLKGQELLIYKYQMFKPAEGGILELHLPVVGQTIHVPIQGK